MASAGSKRGEGGGGPVCEAARCRSRAHARRLSTPHTPSNPNPKYTGAVFNKQRQVAGYSGLLLAAPTVLYEIIAYVVPGLTKSERTFLAPVVFGSSILFYFG